MQAVRDWILQRWTNAASFVFGGVVTAIINKIIDSNNLEWLKAIWTAIAGFFVGLFNLIFSSVPLPVWLLVPVAALAGIPVWQLMKRIRLSAISDQPTLTADQETVLISVQKLDSARKWSAHIPDIVRSTELDSLVVETALDVLKESGHVVRHSTGQYTLQPKGRAHLLARIPSRNEQASDAGA